MKNFIENCKNFIYPNLPAFMQQFILFIWRFRVRSGKISYAQHGEDMVLQAFLQNRKKRGFYVDIGSHHPFYLSNTAYFYKMRWKGINIEASPDLIKAFRRKRHRDINLNLAIANQDAELTFYIFNNQSCNTFNKEEKLHRLPFLKVKKELKIRTYKLSDILDKYLPAGQKIDFMSVDVEGLDLDVLKSNNWERYSPDFILVESFTDFSIENIQKDDIYIFLTNRNYKLIAVTYLTLIFQKIDDNKK
jgi:FkbM family methyltransferase